MVRFREILTVLCKHRVDFVVVGGVAAVLDGAPYTTYDVDVVHRRTPENIDRLLMALSELGARYRSRPDLAPDRSHLESAGHQLLKTTAGPLDVLGEIEGGLDYNALLASSRPVSIGSEMIVQVPTVEVLIRLKEGSSNPKDQLQLGLLRTVQERGA
jgi:hypothetical protein